MSTIYSRYFSALARYQNGDPIDDRDFDGEFNAMTTALNRKVLCSGTAPSNPIEGSSWCDTTNKQLKIYFNSLWQTFAKSVTPTIITGDQILTSADSQSNITNDGASGLITLTLPTASAGLIFAFCVQNVNGIKVVASAGDTIRIFDQVTKDTGYVSSVDVGSTLFVVAINNAEWVAFYSLGKWTLEIS